eukprot:322366_1
MSKSNRHVVVLYGSQTGCAQDVAERIDRELKRRHFTTDLCEMDSFDFSTLPSLKVAVFVASTMGQGEIPDNMKTFFRCILRKNIPAGALSSLQFSVFGLGDSSYQIYNAAARKLFQRLLDLGARAVCPRGLGDDQHDLGYDHALNKWLPQLLNSLMVLFPLPPGLEIIPNDKVHPPKYKVEIHADSTSSSTSESPFEYATGNTITRPFSSKLLINERLTHQEHFQDVRRIRFELDASQHSFSPGDVLSVFPKNPLEAVIAFLKLIDLKPEAVLSVTKTDPAARDLHLPSRVTALELFQTYLDFMGTPRRHFFEMLLHFATEEREIERLEDFISSEGQLDLYRYCQRERRTFAEVLESFKSAIPPLEYLVELIPRLRPRDFSISSSFKAQPKFVEITIALVEYTTPYKREKKGVCSEFLKHLIPGRLPDDQPEVPISLKRGSFHLPATWLSRPLVLVGPGTGLAPFKSIIEERRALRMGNPDMDIGPVAIFLGHRYRERDYLYGSTWEQYLADGALCHLSVAFSRDQKQKIYVQHKLIEHKRIIWKLMEEQKGIFLLAGNAEKMPKDVYNAMLTVFQEEGQMTTAESDKYMKNLVRTRRYQSETWS